VGTTLLLLIPGRRLAYAIITRLGHGELLILFGVFVALVPGYALFEAVGLKGDLGALLLGALLAPHSRSGEIAKAILSVKELLLVAFFVSIGLYGLPTLAQLGLGLVLLVLIPIQTIGYVVILSWLRMRRRTATLAGLALANNSEFGLIVAATAVSSGLIDDGWLATMSVAVAAGLVLAAMVNTQAEPIADWVESRWPDANLERLDPHERPIPLHEVDALVLGLGRVGQAAYNHLRHPGDLQVLGIEHDEERVAHLKNLGYDVVAGDASDAELWRRLVAVRSLRVVCLAMPFHEENLVALRVVRARGFTGRVVAVALHDDSADLLRQAGADEVLHLYSGAGAGLAEAALLPTQRK
jgi:hypothetical protein